MKRFPSSLAAIALLCMASLPSRADQVDDYMRKHMALNHLAGAAIAIVRDGKIIKRQAYGFANLEWRQRATPDTAFQLASSTKPFTGLLLMRLQEAGRLSLDDCVGKYLPNAPQTWQPITLRHLADHSSGIPDNVNAGPNASLDDYVAAAAALPLSHAPGASSRYGIAGYTVLAKVIEVAAGMSYPQALKRYVTAPLKLRADFDYSSGDPNMRSLDVVPKRASIYDWNDGRQREFRFHFAPLSYDAGGLLASVDDLAALAVAIDRGELLREDSLDAMWTPARLANGDMNSFAVGWAVREVNGRAAVGHSGGPALSDILRFTRERTTIIVLTNGQKLYPYLAQGISELFYPPPPVVMPKGIEDERPELSATLRQVLADAAAGKVDDSNFGEQARKDFVPAFKSFLLPYVSSLPAIEEFVLLTDSPKDGGIGRTYRARHGKRAQTWGFDIDRDGKLRAFGPK